MKLTILGCGPSSGVPLVGNFWGACDSSNPKNQRRRTSLLIEDGQNTILIDTSPDLRLQLLDAKVAHVDAVLYSHAHYDQAHGIDDLRPVWFMNDCSAIPIYGSADTIGELEHRFSYLFPGEGSGIVAPNIITDKPFQVCGHTITPFDQDHGHSMTTGYRIGKFGYSTDVKHLDDQAFEALKGIDTWFVDCLDRVEKPSHAHLDLTLQWIERLKPKRAILIHMNHNMDYDQLKKELPPGVEPAFDGMVVDAT